LIPLYVGSYVRWRLGTPAAKVRRGALMKHKLLTECLPQTGREADVGSFAVYGMRHTASNRFF